MKNPSKNLYMIPQPLVSIAMTTYNGAKYLCPQLDSILNQTYTNLEIVICDDCSTDDTKQILTKYSTQDSRIKLFFNEKNLGYSKNFQKAISLCTGDYISLSDQDDIWIPEKISLCVNNIQDYDLICSNSLFIDENNISMNKTMKDSVGYKYIPKNQFKIFKFLCHKNFVQGSTILAKSDFLKSINIPDNFFHDYCFAFNAATKHGIKYINKCLIRYRQHKNQVTTRSQKRNDLFVITKQNDISKHITERLDSLNQLSVFDFNKKQTSYIEETKKYYISLNNKNFYTLKYFIKNC